MRVWLSMYGSDVNVEQIAGLAALSRALRAEMQVCAPPNFAERLDRAGVPPVTMGACR